MIFGFVSSGLMLAVALLAARIYQVPLKQVLSLIALIAAAAPFYSAAIVPAIKLELELRFKAVSIINWLTAAFVSALSVTLAWSHFGAYSIALAAPLGAAFRLALMWYAARPKIQLKAHFRRWKLLMGDSGWILLVALFTVILSQGDYMTLGVFYPDDKSIVGVYYFGFNLSMQATLLLMGNLQAVLFPTLSRLRDVPQRQPAGGLHVRCERLTPCDPPLARPRRGAALV